ncbi:MAG: hypothetical protein ACYDC6_11175 [Acidobacteriaceae bacterium]
MTAPTFSHARRAGSRRSLWWIALVLMATCKYASGQTNAITMRTLTALTNYVSTSSTVNSHTGFSQITVDEIASAENWQRKVSTTAPGTSPTAFLSRMVSGKVYDFFPGYGWTQGGAGELGSTGLTTFASFVKSDLDDPHQLIDNGVGTVAGQICHRLTIHPTGPPNNTRFDDHVCLDSHSGALLQYQGPADSVGNVQTFQVERINTVQPWPVPVVQPMPGAE